jgi:hypothetical protein
MQSVSLEMTRQRLADPVNQTECSICFGDVINTAQTVCSCSNKHFTHAVCLYEWYKHFPNKERECPCCRALINSKEYRTRVQEARGADPQNFERIDQQHIEPAPRRIEGNWEFAARHKKKIVFTIAGAATFVVSFVWYLCDTDCEKCILAAGVSAFASMIPAGMLVLAFYRPAAEL